MKKLDVRSHRIYVGFSGWGYVPEPNAQDYVDWYANEGLRTSVTGEFRTETGAEPRFVFAVYHQPPYSGSAHVIFYRDGKWWYQTGGHCSCNGLEESRWEPEEFDPQLYLWGSEAGKRMFNLEDGEGENPDVTNALFDKWLQRAYRAALPKASGDLENAGIASSPGARDPSTGSPETTTETKLVSRG